MIDYAAILTRKYNAQWVLDGEDYSGLTWLSEITKPTKKELDDLWPVVQTEIANEKIAKVEARRAILHKIGLTEDEAAALLS